MHIKMVKEYSESYCQFVATDNSKDVVCIWDSISSNNGIIPVSGMEIKMLNAFFLNDNPEITIINDIEKQNYKLSKVGMWGMSYSLRGEIVDAERYVLKIYDFYVSLEYLFSPEYIDPQEFIYKKGEWIELIVDRFDAII